MEARTPVTSCNDLWEMMVVWAKVAVVKSKVKIYFGDRTDRLSDRLNVGDYKRGKLRMTSRFLAYVIGWVEVPFSKTRKTGGRNSPRVCVSLFNTFYLKCLYDV